MKTTKNKPSQNGCSPCDIPPFSRNHYFTGKLLTERDFTAEQQYSADKLRLHHVALHGWGVVCGLKVKPHPHCPELRIVVEPGLALDACGREVRVPQEKELLLPSLEPAPVVIEDPCPPEPDSGEAGDETNESYEERTYDPPTLTLYICLRYVERPAELMPAPFNECGCGSSGNQPNRICESYELEILTEEPPCFERVRTEKEEYDSYDSHQIYETLFDHSVEPSEVDCIPLAIIRDFVPGQAVEAKSIHNHRCRRLLPSTTVLDHLIRCILKRIPTRTLTKIIEIGWAHRGEYHCHDFMRLFIGEHEQHTPGFVVTFDRPVRTEAITPRTFQAIAIRYLEKTDGAGAPEIVPAEVKWNPERTRIHLKIDRQYARNRLDRTRFDLYLLVRCNLIVDDRGFAVDGELLGKLDSDGEYVASFPTGDGIAGGLFESWIRVIHTDIHEGGSHVYHT